VRHACGLSHEQLTAMAATEAPGCGGATFLPYLAGERTPNWPQATGALLGERAPDAWQLFPPSMDAF
jgi:xylulokinase